MDTTTRKRRKELDKQFWKFHKKNPKVWKLFVKFTFQIIKRGFENYSARAVIHRIRWHTNIETTGSQYKICNNHASRYARLFHHEFPEYKGFFKTRKRKRNDPGKKS